MIRSFATGGCDCGAVRYALLSAPIFTHCRHCSWMPSASGKGQKIARRPKCRVAAWSQYATLATKLAFVRVGTLDDPSRCPPDVHIFTSTKQPWVLIPAGAESYAEFYSAADRVRMFGPERMARREAKIEEAKRESC